jgi:hypothetical protein
MHPRVRESCLLLLNPVVHGLHWHVAVVAYQSVFDIPELLLELLSV